MNTPKGSELIERAKAKPRRTRDSMAPDQIRQMVERFRTQSRRSVSRSDSAVVKSLDEKKRLVGRR